MNYGLIKNINILENNKIITVLWFNSQSLCIKNRLTGKVSLINLNKGVSK